MKNRIYKIKDKILVQGNENELTKDEVLVKEENGSVVLKERVNGEVKDIVIKGGNSTTTEINVSSNSTLGQSETFAPFLYQLSEEEKNEIINATMPIVINTPNQTLTILNKSNISNVYLLSGYVTVEVGDFPIMCTIQDNTLSVISNA